MDNRLTKKQKDLAWYYLNALDDNTDQEIADRIGATKSRVSTYLGMRSRKLLEKINNRKDVL